MFAQFQKTKKQIAPKDGGCQHADNHMNPQINENDPASGLFANNDNSVALRVKSETQHTLFF